MKTGKTLFIISILLIGLGGAFLYYTKYNREALPSFISENIVQKKYIIKKAGRIIDSADTIEEAIGKAKVIKRSIAINTYNNEWVYSEFKPFLIITKEAVHDFDDLAEAIQYAKNNSYPVIHYKDNEHIIWQAKLEELKEIQIDVPLINQNPELPRGCEVTSLTMIMQHAGINIDKMTLAAEVRKDTTPYQKKDGKTISGNPYDGFVGDMYNIKNFGYGVYHGPIVEIAKKYSPNNTMDLTGLEFEDILSILQKGNPIWVITNFTYNTLDDSQFEIWHTPTGIVKITYRLHSVVLTGFDKDNVYINDPLSSSKNKRVNRENFKKAWEQMGNQAVVVLK